MTDEKDLAFFEEVFAKTRAGKIPWEPTATEQNYIAPIGGQFVFGISELNRDDSYGGPSFTYVLILSDADGRVLSRVDSDHPNVRWDLAQELYETARRQALRVDDKIDKALGVLRRL
jgi:hypothetical protein